MELVEAGRLWYEDICTTLEDDGFKRNEHDRCVFNKTVDGVQVTVLLYVDDLLITSVEHSLVEAVVDLITKKYKQVTYNIGNIHDYLGMVFDITETGRVKVFMTEYLKNVLALANIEGTVATPATSKLFDVSADSPKLDRKSAKRFHTIVAKLLYMSKRTRIDIMTAVSFLCTRVREPTVEDLAKLTRVLKYLNGTVNHYIILSIGDDFEIIVYVDASFAIHMDGKGHTGIFITLGIGPIYCRSSKHKSVSASTSEAEIITLGDAYPIILWVRLFLIDQGYEMGPVIVNEDNTAVLAMIENGVATSYRTRHFRAKHFLIKEGVDRGDLMLVHCRTWRMIADMFTKPLQGRLFVRFAKWSMLGEAPDAEIIEGRAGQPVFAP